MSKEEKRRRLDISDVRPFPKHVEECTMANAVILILVIGYCLFLIYKQVQNRKAGKHLGCTGCGGSCGGCSGCSACRTEGNKKKH